MTRLLTEAVIGIIVIAATVWAALAWMPDLDDGPVPEPPGAQRRGGL